MDPKNKLIFQEKKYRVVDKAMLLLVTVLEF
jgi:hypothetical protein